MSESPFIGIGNNPSGVDLPLGLGMGLAQDPEAMYNFGKMSNTQKNELINYIQSGVSGEDAKERMANAINRLHNNEIQF